MTSPTKLDRGRQNAVQPSQLVPNASLPFDVPALYCYLIKRAEDEFTPGTPEAVCSLFETEFACRGSIPDNFLGTLQHRFEAAGLTTMPSQDDLKRDAAIKLFAIEYAKAYAENPQGLPNPRGVTATATATRLSPISQLRRSIRRIFARL